MKKNLYFFLALVILTCLPFLQSQAQMIEHQCGTTVEDQDLIKERLFENRRNKVAILEEYASLKQSRTSADSIIWIPVVMHMCSKADGTGQNSDSWAVQEICYLNQNFADQNIQFYLERINRFNSTQMYVNQAQTADYIRSIHKVSGVINIFVGGPPAAGTSYGAYYAPFYDWIFTWNNIYNWGLTHEVGHMLTLPHTFNGWEGMDYTTASAPTGKAPEMGTNGRPVEKVVRGAAGENCQWAADGFCDTAPDFSSGGGGCTAPTTWRDPDSMLISPDVYNVMSYFFCTPKRFSNDQKEAMKLDVLSRGFQNLAPPYPLEVVGTASAIWPEQGALAPYTASPIRFNWSPADSANRYLVTINRTMNNGSTVLAQHAQIYTSQTEVWVQLNPNQEYTWTVKSMTAYNGCTGTTTSTPTTFKTANWATPITELGTPIQSSRIFPNPISRKGEVIVEVNVLENTDAQLSIFNSLGQQVMPRQTVSFSPGNSLQHIGLDMLPAGIYMVNIETAKERVSHKLVIQD